MFKIDTTLRLCFAWLTLSSISALADDWPRFRGPNGSGVSVDSDTLPNTWSPSANLAWKTPLPGPGASSPIIVGGKVLVTCYSGYGTSQEDRRDIDNLTRHLICIDLKTGEVAWQADVQASLPEDSYFGTGVSSHGYASHTPVSDGSNVYCFFGKGGVYGFDLNGRELWHADAGKESDPPKWGSSSSPILYEDTLVITASAECQSIIGFDKTSGRKLWQQEATGLDGMWGTPAMVKVNEDRTDIVMLVANELWGLEPATGKLRWQSEETGSQQAYASIVSDGTRVFASSGGGSIALDLAGDNPRNSATHLWNGRLNATYASPVHHNGRLYVFSRGILSVADANSGERLQQVRLTGARKTGNARFGSLDYASPIVAGERLFYLNASGQMFVFELGENVRLLAVNEVTSEQEVFWGSPAVSDGQMILRSSKHLYCVTDKGQSMASGGLDVPKPDVVTSDLSAPTLRRDERRRGVESDHRREDSARTDSVPRPERPQRPVSVDR